MFCQSIIDDAVGAHYDKASAGEEDLPDDAGFTALRDYWNSVLYDLDKME